MFIKFKKFALMFVLCMGIFGTTAFAEVIPNTITDEISKYNSETKSTLLIFQGNQYKLYVMNGDKNYSVGYSQYDYGISSGLSGNCYIYSADGVYSQKVSFSAGTLFVSVTGKTESSLLELKNIIKYSKNDVKNGTEVFFSGKPQVEVVTPTPTQVTQIIPHLLSQLKILLPVGVILLSIMLGVSLVPRLVHLFL